MAVGRVLLEEGPGTAERAPEAQPEWVVPGAGRPLHPTHHSGPCRACGPASLVGFAPRAVWLGTRYSHPYYPPGIPHPGTIPMPVLASCTGHMSWLGRSRDCRDMHI